MALLILNLNGLLNKTIRHSRYLIVLFSLLLLSGCQLLSLPNKDNVEFNHYYLWIKSLNDEEILQEISRQKSNKLSGLVKADMQLIMLYSLPNSPIHNPYTAKAQLNDYPLESYEYSVFNAADLAFVVMLKDQLNQQLLILEQLNNYKGAYKQSKEFITEQNLEVIEAKKTINQLNKKIIQLKKIEKAISEHGQ